MSAASTETSAPLPTAGSRVFFQPPTGVGCVGSAPITAADDPVQKKQGKVTVKYDRKELRKRLVLEEWIIEQLSELYDCEVSGPRTCAPHPNPPPIPPLRRCSIKRAGWSSGCFVLSSFSIICSATRRCFWSYLESQIVRRQSVFPDSLLSEKSLLASLCPLQREPTLLLPQIQ